LWSINTVLHVKFANLPKWTRDKQTILPNCFMQGIKIFLDDVMWSRADPEILAGGGPRWRLPKGNNFWRFERKITHFGNIYLAQIICKHWNSVLQREVRTPWIRLCVIRLHLLHPQLLRHGKACYKGNTSINTIRTCDSYKQHAIEDFTRFVFKFRRSR